jgi:hypothetical protein
VTTNAKPLGTFRAPRHDFDIDEIKLVGDKNVVATLRRSTAAVDHEQTLEGASTVTIKVRDAERGLLRSNIPQTRATMVLDEISYTLVKVARQGHELTLTFEETAVNLLRRYDSPKKANRDNTTRAQFIRSLVDEVKEAKIPFQCPELSERQPVASA